MRAGARRKECTGVSSTPLSLRRQNTTSKLPVNLESKLPLEMTTSWLIFPLLQEVCRQVRKSRTSGQLCMYGGS